MQNIITRVHNDVCLGHCSVKVNSQWTTYTHKYTQWPPLLVSWPVLFPGQSASLLFPLDYPSGRAFCADKQVSHSRSPENYGAHGWIEIMSHKHSLDCNFHTHRPQWTRAGQWERAWHPYPWGPHTPASPAQPQLSLTVSSWLSVMSPQQDTRRGNIAETFRADPKHHFPRSLSMLWYVIYWLNISDSGKQLFKEAKFKCDKTAADHV